jgi:signal transduction histidine kinase
VVVFIESGPPPLLPDAELLTPAGRLLDADSLAQMAGFLSSPEVQQLNRHLQQDADVYRVMERLGCNYALPLRFERRLMGCLLVDSYPMRELGELEDLLLALSGQIAACIANGRLLKSKLLLEREMARQEQLVALGRVSATMAHEVRNPLGSIKTLVQLMMEDRELAGSRNEELKMINEQIDRLNHTVTQLLSFSRPRSRVEEESDTQEKIQLEDLLRSTAVVVRNSGGNAERCRFEFTLPPEIPMLSADAALLQEIFLNLFLNAVQAGPGPRLIRVTGFREKRKQSGLADVVLEITDDGPGIPAAVQPHIFEAFYTTRQRGTGLGLYIIKRNVEALGGSILFRSPLGDAGGTLFRITLPIQP